MPLRLPTDTRHLRPITRQYEIFGRRLGQGIERRRIWVGAGFALPWWALLGLVGVAPWDQFGPILWIVPVAVVAVLGTRVDESGRMALMVAYDWLLSRRRSRRQILRNPALPAADRELGEPERIQVHTYVEQESKA